MTCDSAVRSYTQLVQGTGTPVPDECPQGCSKARLFLTHRRGSALAGDAICTGHLVTFPAVTPNQVLSTVQTASSGEAGA